MTKNTNIVLGVVCAGLVGVCAVLTVKLIKKKNYIDILEYCYREDANLNDFFDDEE